VISLERPSLFNTRAISSAKHRVLAPGGRIALSDSLLPHGDAMLPIASAATTCATPRPTGGCSGAQDSRTSG
jgi:hypothetical protein